jgi:hypothetical protein
MYDGGIDTAFVHQDDGLRRGKGRHLSMREVARQPGSPEVNLRVDYLHRMFSPHGRAGHPRLRQGAPSDEKKAWMAGPGPAKGITG